MANRSFLCAEKPRMLQPTPFGNKFSSTFQKEQLELQNNCRQLAHKFPTESTGRIKQLLEQFNNSVEMVQEVLQESALKVEVENKGRKTVPFRKLSAEQQNKMLKKAIATLHNKLKDANIKLKQLQGKNQSLTKENEFYKNRNRLLCQQKFSQEFERNLDIC